MSPTGSSSSSRCRMAGRASCRTSSRYSRPELSSRTRNPIWRPPTLRRKRRAKRIAVMAGQNTGQDTVYVIYIASTPEKVWQALTTATFSKQYFFGFAVEMEPKIGGTFKVLAPDGSLHIDGEVIAHDPPHRLTVTWNVTWPGLVDKLGNT